jgi:hypothetical protein
VRSTCDSERPTTVTHGQSWSLDGCVARRADNAFALVRALETSPKLVVRDRVELPTFRFQGERPPISQPLAEVSVADTHPPRCSIVSARGTAAIEEDGEEQAQPPVQAGPRLAGPLAGH